MATFIQVVPFNHKKMGTKPGWCERNMRLGYGNIPARCADAKADMEYNKKMGTLHSVKKASDIPSNVSVPLFIDTKSTYEHIECSDKGVVYSDGKVVKNPMSQKIFGWGEYCAKTRVVKKAADPKPAGIKVGDSVIVNGAGTGNSKGGGGKTKVFKNQKMKVLSITNGRYGCNQYNKSGAITGWWASSQVKKA